MTTFSLFNEGLDTADLANILETINDAILVLDDSGKVININSEFCRLINISAAECLGADVCELTPLGQIPKLVIDRLIREKCCVVLTESINDRQLLVFGNCLVDQNGKCLRVVMVFKDLGKLNEMLADVQRTNATDPDFNDNSEIRDDGIIVGSSVMKRLVTLALRVAKVDSTILITGETGVGKEILASIIHKHSARNEGPFVKLNCGALPEQLLESELFGYDPGAFTGAKREGKPGLIETANRGTLFLDEIGDFPIRLQVKLLRVLQEREIQRVGGTKILAVDFRLIAATNRDLETMVTQKLFREDLFFRLNVIPIHIPPLKERKEDIGPLANYYMQRFNRKYGFQKKMSVQVLKSFLDYDWPGNVRELENTVERLIVTNDSNLILTCNLGKKGLQAEEKKVSVRADNSSNDLDLRNMMEETEKKVLQHAAESCGNTREMAAVLGISQSAVVKKLRKYGISIRR